MASQSGNDDRERMSIVEPLHAGQRTNISDDYARLIPVDGSELLVFRGKTLAVAAPRGVELNEGVSGRVLGDGLIKIALGEHGHVARRTRRALGPQSSLALNERDKVVFSSAALVLVRLVGLTVGEPAESRETAPNARQSVRPTLNNVASRTNAPLDVETTA